MTTTSQNEIAALRLITTPHVGAKTTLKLLQLANRLDMPLDALLALPRRELVEISEGQIDYRIAALITQSNESELKRWADALDRHRCLVTCIGSPDYPRRILDRLGGDAPPVLFYRGLPPSRAGKMAAIIGSRHASAHGLEAARRIARALAQAEYDVISGYASGIDEAAHVGTLEVGGRTTAVLAEGILGFSLKRSLRAAPSDENHLRAISQFAPFERWSGRNAMARNALVCALADAVVVVESGESEPGKSSGAFEGAKAALQLGVPLFVLDPSESTVALPAHDRLIAAGGIKVSQDDVAYRIQAHPYDSALTTLSEGHADSNLLDSQLKLPL